MCCGYSVQLAAAREGETAEGEPDKRKRSQDGSLDHLVGANKDQLGIAMPSALATFVFAVSGNWIRNRKTSSA
jgi:hypothetical protein